jgi:hypothetical protein
MNHLRVVLCHRISGAGDECHSGKSDWIMTLTTSIRNLDFVDIHIPFVFLVWRLGRRAALLFVFAELRHENPFNEFLVQNFRL